jgi:hypothetical protein
VKRHERAKTARVAGFGRVPGWEAGLPKAMGKTVDQRVNQPAAASL